MIYIMIFLCVVICILIIWINDLKRIIKYKEERIKDRSQTIQMLKEMCNEKEEDIRTLITGGLCEQEAIQMKYQKKYDDEARSRQIALAAHQRQNSGLRGLFGITSGLYQPRF